MSAQVHQPLSARGWLQSQAQWCNRSSREPPQTEERWIQHAHPIWTDTGLSNVVGACVGLPGLRSHFLIEARFSSVALGPSRGRPETAVAHLMLAHGQLSSNIERPPVQVMPAPQHRSQTLAAVQLSSPCPQGRLS